MRTRACGRCEALYLYGVLLLLLDATIEGPVRERILITYYRHKGNSAIESIEDMELLLRSSGHAAHALDRSGMPRRPAGYPEEYFGRLPRKLGLPASLVLMMIDRLRSDDMYSQIPSYPAPQHRSTALATQARMLYVLLYFAPDVLENQHHMMREIVDRHFAGADACWVVPYYMGYIDELPHVWERYPAAKAALANTANPQAIKALYSSHLSQVPPRISARSPHDLRTISARSPRDLRTISSGPRAASRRCARCGPSWATTSPTACSPTSTRSSTPPSCCTPRARPT